MFCFHPRPGYQPGLPKREHPTPAQMGLRAGTPAPVRSQHHTGLVTVKRKASFSSRSLSAASRAPPEPRITPHAQLQGSAPGEVRESLSSGRLHWSRESHSGTLSLGLALRGSRCRGALTTEGGLRDETWRRRVPVGSSVIGQRFEAWRGGQGWDAGCEGSTQHSCAGLWWWVVRTSYCRASPGPESARTISQQRLYL